MLWIGSTAAHGPFGSLPQQPVIGITGRCTGWCCCHICCACLRQGCCDRPCLLRQGCDRCCCDRAAAMPAVPAASARCNCCTQACRTAHLRSGMLSTQLYRSPMSYVMLRSCGFSSRSLRSNSAQMPAA